MLSAAGATPRCPALAPRPLAGARRPPFRGPWQTPARRARLPTDRRRGAHRRRARRQAAGLDSSHTSV